MSIAREYFETVIIGAGQAGLATSYHLQQQGREHIVLERAARAAPAWSEGRWDSFTLVTPNWSVRMPGAEYAGPDPDGFMSRDEVAAYFDDYVTRFALPVRYGVEVIDVGPKEGSQGFEIVVGERVIEAANVVMATGLFQRPRLPACASALPPQVNQLHSSQYRNPGQLVPGAVLVVGSSQSGCQIADELARSERRVYLCVGGAGRAPRRYRGKDSSQWQELMGVLERTVDKLPSPRAKFAANPHTAGRTGGAALNLHLFARAGITLLGRLQEVRDGKLLLAPDLADNLARADKFEADFTKLVDGFIERQGMEAPLEALPQLRDGYAAPILSELDLAEAVVTNVVWAAGYSFDFSMARFPIFDADGYPVQTRGVTEQPGLYFVGLPWLHKQKSGLLRGVGDDAAYVAEDVAGREASRALLSA